MIEPPSKEAIRAAILEQGPRMFDLHNRPLPTTVLYPDGTDETIYWPQGGDHEQREADPGPADRPASPPARHPGADRAPS